MTFNGMVYAGKANGRELKFGVSGRLDKSNLVMWDPETKTLWNQMLGLGVYGELSGATLALEPALFVPLGAWKKLHPDTLVMDMSAVEATQWHYTARDLKRGTIHDGRKPMALGVGLRRGEHSVVVPLSRLHQQGVLIAALGFERRLVVWNAKDAAITVYDIAEDFELSPEQDFLSTGHLKTRAGAQIDGLSGRILDPQGQPTKDGLKRAPYIPTLVDPWMVHHPKSKRLDL